MRGLHILGLYLELLCCRCSCRPEGKRLQFDGITIGFHRSRCCVCCPWSADVSSPPTNGSVFLDRLFVKDRASREALLALVQDKSKPSGLPAEALGALISTFDRLPVARAEKTLLPLLRRYVPTLSFTLLIIQHYPVSLLVCFFMPAPSGAYIMP